MLQNFWCGDFCIQNLNNIRFTGDEYVNVNYTRDIMIANITWSF